MSETPNTIRCCEEAMILREEIRKLAEKTASNLIQDGWAATADDFESAILAGIRLVLEREPTNEMFRATHYSTEIPLGRTICGPVYRAMTTQLLKELEP